jgi:ribonuclease HI
MMTTGLKLAQLNTGKSITCYSRSIQFLAHLQLIDASVVLLQETKQSNTISTPGWTVYSHDSCSIYIRSNLRSAHYPSLSISRGEFVCCAAQLFFPDSNIPIVVASIYRHIRSSDHSAQEFFSWLHQQVLKHSTSNFVFGGDFNYHSTLFGCVRDDPNVHLLEDIHGLLAPHGRFLNDGSPTRTGWPAQRGLVNPSAIDLTYVHSPDGQLCFRDWTSRPVDHSDHSLISFSIHAQQLYSLPSAVRHKRYTVLHANFDDSNIARYSIAVDAEMHRRNFGNLHPSTAEEVESLAVSLTGVLQAAAYKHKLIVYTFSDRQRPPTLPSAWTNECAALRLDLEAAHMQLQNLLHLPNTDQSLLAEARDKLQATSDQLDRIASLACRDSWRNYCSHLDPDVPASVVWTKYRNLLLKYSGRKIKSNGLSLLDPTGRLLHAVEQAQALADFYSQVSSLPDQVPAFPPPPPPPPHSLPDSYNDPITTVELLRALQQSNHSSAPGADGISYKLIHSAGPLFMRQLLALMNASLSLACFPDCWKVSSVTALPKTASAHSCKDFRPISLLSCLGKLMEKVVAERLSFYLESNSFFTSDQSGFRKRQGTVDALLRVVQSVHQYWAAGSDAILVALDIHKAFDTVWHAGLLFKLEHYARVRGNMLSWIGGYLSNRRGYVRVGDYVSEEVLWERGVPQGSVLGPLLFVVFINDLLALLPSTVLTQLYADDCALCCELPATSGEARDCAVSIMQNSLNDVSLWCQQWMLKLSDPKSQLMVFRKCRVGRNIIPLLPPPTLTINGYPVQVESIFLRYLGLYLDPRLTFHHHIDYVCSSIQPRLQLLQFISGSDWGCDRAGLRLLYLNWIRPKLEYASSLLLSISSASVSKLEAVQRTALRKVLGATRMASGVSLNIQAEIPPLAVRRISAATNLLLKIRHSPPSNALKHKWLLWFRSSQEDIKPFPVDITGCFRPPHTRPSPFAILKTIGNELRLFSLIRNPAPPVADKPPWTLHELTPNPLPEWPRLGAASSRAGNQVRTASRYADEVFSRLVRPVLSNDGGGLVIYTDGSALSGPLGGTGLALIVLSSLHSPPVVKRFMSNPCLSNYDVELYAISAALLWAIRTHSDCSFTHLLILSDCQSAITAAINSHRSTSSCDAVLRSITRLKEQLSSLNVRFSIDWVPGHSGCALNELADREARAAALDSKGYRSPSCTIPVPLAAAQLFARVNILHRYQLWWSRSKRGRFLHQFHPLWRGR